MQNKKRNSKNKGITLVALVITIVVLVILATITIQEVSGDGIFSKAKSSAEEYKEGVRIEKISTLWSNMETNYQFERIENIGLQKKDYFVKENINKLLDETEEIEKVIYNEKDISYIYYSNKNENKQYIYSIDTSGKVTRILFAAQVKEEMFKTLKEAILFVSADLDDVVEVKLLQDVYEEIEIASGQKIKLNLNGFSLNGQTKTILNNGILYLDGGKVTTSGYAIYNNGTLIIGQTKECHIESSGGVSVIYGNGYSGSKVELYSGKIVNTSEGTCVKSYGSGANFIMHDGEIEVNKGYAVELTTNRKSLFI